MTEEVIPLDKLARVYRKIRDRVQLLTKEYETQVEELKAQQNEIKIAMKDQMRAIGSSSIRTSEGTIVLVQKVRYSVDWLKEHTDIEYLFFWGASAWPRWFTYKNMFKSVVGISIYGRQ